MKHVAAIVAVALVLALNGCGKAPQAPVSTNHVEMARSYRFDPQVIRVAAGTTVTWHNGDNFTHSVVFTQGIETSLNLAPGESGTIRFDQPGEYEYVCSFHTQQMKGKVIVSGN